jgi:XTP/dITP diphosphohydrolase
MIPKTIIYVTGNSHKHEEIQLLNAEAVFTDGTPVRDVFSIEVRPVSIPERLEIDLEVMVEDEAVRAYEVLKVPCIVEHAGLIFDGFDSAKYPGGLTKPMWNALGASFLKHIHPPNDGATAKAVVGYCDGKAVRVFVGTTHGRLADAASGSRSFYWDTIFIPDDPKRPGATLTYAAIVEDASLGLRYKVLELSQSSKAMLRCLHFVRENPKNSLWV